MSCRNDKNVVIMLNNSVKCKHNWLTDDDEADDGDVNVRVPFVTCDFYIYLTFMESVICFCYLYSPILPCCASSRG